MDNILHIGAVQLRVVGNGVLFSTLLSLDDIESSPLESIILSNKNSRLSSMLANFVTPQAKLKLTMNNIDEKFTVTKVTFFIAPIYSEFPG